jgi:glycerol uptake facilitator-like aquaporin
MRAGEEGLVTLPLAKRAVVEGLGTALLLATVVGSGIMAEDLAQGNVAIALLANTIATGAVLIALILALGPVSGAHFNPVVTLVLAWRRDFARREAPVYLVAQFVGAIIGVVLAHLMFDLAPLAASAHARDGASQGLSEVVATFGLVLIILLVGKRRDATVPYAVGAYITAAYWFTASTSFANPAVTLARALTPTFAGIRPSDVPLYVGAQLAGAALAALVVRWIEGPRPTEATQ